MLEISFADARVDRGVGGELAQAMRDEIGLRGRGVARRLLHELEHRARGLGYEFARLDTGPKQGGARGLYESEGYREVPDFNRNPVAVFWGEKPLGYRIPISELSPTRNR